VPHLKNFLVKGIIFRSADGKRIAQFRIDGFTFNQLAPYTEWKEVFGTAQQLWNDYYQTGNVQSVSRIAVRYINRISLPLPLNLSEYVIGSVLRPEKWPKDVQSMLSRLVLVENDILANVTQLLEGPAVEGHIPLIFDIDVYKEKPFDRSELGALPRDFEELRDMKNRIFYENLTEKAKAMFQ